jgi:uncharacterized membrane protein YheB (UPF0754 family)
LQFHWLDLTIPVVAAVIGYVTNVAAVRMMFYPLDFVGVPPFLGWQGIIPRNARGLARKSTRLITEQLLDLRKLFATFDAGGFAGRHMSGVLDQLTDQVIAEIAEKRAGRTWQDLPDPVKQQVRAMIRAEVGKVVVDILADMGEHIDSILDIEHIVVEAVTADKALMGEMFLTVGDAEFRFIKISGLYFGFAFGLFQLLAWLLYPAWWSLPLAGFVVGYVTNWLALKLIFEPAEPRKVGPFVLHGLFHKRQAQVAHAFAEKIAGEVVNADNMVTHMTSGPGGDKLLAIIERHLGAMVERYRHDPMAAALVPADQWDAIRAELLTRIRAELPARGGFLHVFTSKSVDIYKELFDRMTVLDADSFEGVLRPAFKQDEWKLIVVGAVLGMAAGGVQVLYMLGDKVT